MKIVYKDLEITTRKGEEIPKGFKPILEKIEEILEEIRDQVNRGLLPKRK